MTDTPEVTAPVTTQLPDDWDVHATAELVHDLAVNMHDEATILRHHNLTPEQFNALKNNEFFKKCLDAAIMDWNSPNSVQKRLALKAALALEKGMQSMGARLSNGKEPLTSVAQLAKLFADMSGVVGREPQQNAQGEKFRIEIHLGDERVAIEKTRPTEPIREVVEGESHHLEIPALPEGARHPAPVSPEPIETGLHLQVLRKSEAP